MGCEQGVRLSVSDWQEVDVYQHMHMHILQLHRAAWAPSSSVSSESTNTKPTRNSQNVPPGFGLPHTQCVHIIGAHTLEPSTVEYCTFIVCAELDLLAFPLDAEACYFFFFSPHFPTHSADHCKRILGFKTAHPFPQHTAQKWNLFCSN